MAKTSVLILVIGRINCGFFLICMTWSIGMLVLFRFVSTLKMFGKSGYPYKFDRTHLHACVDKVSVTQNPVCKTLITPI